MYTRDMHYTVLPGTDLRVSRICLGTMGFAAQVNETDTYAQLEYALDRGVQFWDTAEMYPIPTTPERFGSTEEYLGRWFARTGRRSEVVLGTKITGPHRYDFLRKHDRFDTSTLTTAIEASLRRLQTDTIDLYQLHWPERRVAMFGEQGFVTDSSAASENIHRTLQALQAQVQAGKIRAVGLSNETPWGVMEFLRLARQHGLPVVSTIQNAYNLLNRRYELGLAEVTQREGPGLLAYSPLGYGVLGGRYLNGAFPPGGRFTLHRDFAIRYRYPHLEPIVVAYRDLAQAHGLSLASLALAFVHRQTFVTATIIGASTLAQLKEDIDSIDVTLSNELMQGIESIHARHPNPVA